MFLINGAVYGPVIWLVKLALFLLFFDIFGQLRWMRYCIKLGILVTGLFYLSNLIAFLTLVSTENILFLDLMNKNSL